MADEWIPLLLVGAVIVFAIWKYVCAEDEKESNKKYLLPPPPEQEEAELKALNPTPEELKFARNTVDYICMGCGYHQGASWRGGVRRCAACGGWLRYETLAQRVIHSRKVAEEWQTKR